MTSPGFTCPVCGTTSHHPQDVREGYCGACHDWTGAAKGLVAMQVSRDGDELEMYFDRAGQPITLARWVWLFRDLDYRSLGDDILDDGIRVSTVWLGISTTVDGPPEMFETVVFIDDAPTVMHRYTSEGEALSTHRTLVRSIELVGRKFVEDELAERERSIAQLFAAIPSVWDNQPSEETP